MVKGRRPLKGYAGPGVSHAALRRVHSRGVSRGLAAEMRQQQRGVTMTSSRAFARAKAAAMGLLDIKVPR